MSTVSDFFGSVERTLLQLNNYRSWWTYSTGLIIFFTMCIILCYFLTLCLLYILIMLYFMTFNAVFMSKSCSRFGHSIYFMNVVMLWVLYFMPFDTVSLCLVADLIMCIITGISYILWHLTPCLCVFQEIQSLVCVLLCYTLFYTIWHCVFVSSSRFNHFI